VKKDILNAVRQIPMCHLTPLAALDSDFLLKRNQGGRGHRDLVRKDGVERKALTWLAAALVNVWDMVKCLETDKMVNYSETEIKDYESIGKEKVLKV